MYYIEVLKKYAVFSGRARRKEYWMFSLFNIIIVVALVVILSMAGGDPGSSGSLLINIYQLAVLIPGIAVSVRRMHDVNKSGWYIFIPIYNFILTLTPGTTGDNKYGPDPKAVNA